jgi:endonuclease G
MHRSRKLAFIAAVNYDPTARFSHPRDKGADKWFYDERIGKGFQLGESLYASNPLGRGHLARRNDAGWGDTKEEAKACSDDTFFFPNCSPQHEIFNQSTKADKAGVKLWGHIEEHIMKQGKKNKARVTIFNGPIFGSNDRPYRGALLPREYWKIVVFAGEDEGLRAAAFKLSQESLIKGEVLKEKFDFEPYETFQVAISSLSEETGLDFSMLVGIDTAPPEGVDESFTAGVGRISRLEEIRL